MCVCVCASTAHTRYLQITILFKSIKKQKKKKEKTKAEKKYVIFHSQISKIREKLCVSVLLKPVEMMKLK